MSATPFADLKTLAEHLRDELESKRFILLYAYNGTGKTRLSTEFKNLGKKDEARDTLYFNAFTEDLFSWDNDLDGDSARLLKINSQSRFFDGLDELEMDNRIRPLLNRYADFGFRINTENWHVRFFREITIGQGEEAKTEVVDGIKISRGEENIFIWCFFLAILQLALDGAKAYDWVKFVYIDDPISSLDEQNAIAVAQHLTQIFTASDKGPKAVVSTHHTLFFNVLCNEFRKKAIRHFLQKGAAPGSYTLQNTESKPFLHHLATLAELDDCQKTGALYTHHFNMMRRVMEQTANYFGLSDWTECLRVEEDDPEKPLLKRLIDLMSHGDYSLFEPREMMDENKNHFRKIFRGFILHYPFNPHLFPHTHAPTVPAATNTP